MRMIINISSIISSLIYTLVESRIIEPMINHTNNSYDCVFQSISTLSISKVNSNLARVVKTSTIIFIID